MVAQTSPTAVQDQQRDRRRGMSRDQRHHRAKMGGLAKAINRQLDNPDRLRRLLAEREAVQLELLASRCADRADLTRTQAEQLAAQAEQLAAQARAARQAMATEAAAS